MNFIDRIRFRFSSLHTRHSILVKCIDKHIALGDKLHKMNIRIMEELGKEIERLKKEIREKSGGG